MTKQDKTETIKWERRARAKARDAARARDNEGGESAGREDAGGRVEARGCAGGARRVTGRGRVGEAGAAWLGPEPGEAQPCR
eukprot:scaffold92123_cov31-Tisochrysis_lutea.AAC.1